MAKAIDVRQISKAYRRGLERPTRLSEALLSRRHRHGYVTFWALQDVSFSVDQGEVLGIIGRNGSGKSTLLKVLSQITSPTRGAAEISGRVGSLLEVGTGFHPDLTGRDNVYLNGSILGMSRKEIERSFEEIVEFSGVSEFLDTPVKRYSSGMSVRLAFSVAAHLRTEILLVDEVLAVGDLSFQRKCLGKMGEVARSGRTVVLVSHDLAAVSSLCDRVVVLAGGRVVHEGETAEAVAAYVESQAGQVGGRDVSSREDRRGEGRVRFHRVWVEGEGGAATDTVQTGERISLCAAYASLDGLNLADPDVAFGVYDHLGRSVTDLWSSGSGHAWHTAPATGILRCTLARLPLNAGRYRFNVLLRSRGVLEDAMTEACEFDVIRGDYFGSGRMSRSGIVVMDQSWSVAEEHPLGSP